MRRSVSNKARCLLVVLSGTCLVASARADDYVDDDVLKTRFEKTLESLYSGGGIPKASAILRELRSAKAIEWSPPAPVSPAAPVDPVQHALGATLVIGHLYWCEECKSRHGSFAGGIALSPDGIVLTNYHVLDVSDAVVFGAMSRSGEVFPIEKVLAASEKDDLALVQLRGAKDLPVVTLADSVNTGEEIFVISHPDGYFYSLTRGDVSRKFLLGDDKVQRLQVTADFAQGSSGAGIYNRDGKVVGLVTTTHSIYYYDEKEDLEDLQMVVKAGVPLDSIRRLIGAPGAVAEQTSANSGRPGGASLPVTRDP